jgi:hypothetical protein
MAGSGSTLPPILPSEGRLTTVSQWIAPGLRPFSAAHCRSMHQSTLRQVVVLHCPMLHGAIVRGRPAFNRQEQIVDELSIDSVELKDIFRIPFPPPMSPFHRAYPEYRPNITRSPLACAGLDLRPLSAGILIGAVIK